MAKSYVGEFRDGVVIFDETPTLSPGTRVRVESIEPARSLADRYAAIIGIADGLPTDLAEQHDHYIHGAPRRDAE